MVKSLLLKIISAWPIQTTAWFFEGEDASLYWAKFTDETGAIADVIQYQPLSEIEPLLYKDSLTGVILPWALGAGGAGLIGAAASGGA